VSETQPISWRSIVYGTPVISRDEERVGKVDEVLGSDAEDIFHGLRVALGGGHREVMVSGDDVASMSVDEVRTNLTRSDIEALPTYDDVATYHLASVGWLRKHLGWKKDAKSDEEPG
jgi:PRC-barrel domain